LEFYTFFHLSDAIQLHVADISFPSQPNPHLGISFPEPKNDQYTIGSKKLAASLPFTVQLRNLLISSGLRVQRVLDTSCPCRPPL
jgi:hypothetical protein